MLLLPWKIPPIDPCDATALDAIENLSDAELAELMGATSDNSPADRATAPVATRARFGIPGWHALHRPGSSYPPNHFHARP